MHEEDDEEEETVVEDDAELTMDKLNDELTVKCYDSHSNLLNHVTVIVEWFS